jgi:peptidoglycan hydrolase-like protein with peptidoglycan-binding domain
MAVTRIDCCTTASSRRGLDVDPRAPRMSTVAYGQASLRYGMRGPAVEQLHQKLSSAGFPVSGDRFDGKTVDAVKEFQSARGLDATGVVGLHTMEAFESSFEPNRKPPVALTPPTQVQPEAPSAPSAGPPRDATRAQRRSAARRTLQSRRAATRRASRRSRRSARAGQRPAVRRAPQTPAGTATAPAATPPPTTAVPGTQPAQRPAATTAGSATAAPTPATPSTQPAGQPGQYERLATQRLGAAFVAQARQVAQRLGVSPEGLFAMMNNESGLNPRAVNGGSGATGLIQFMPATARALGTTTAALRNMSSTDQLTYVGRYFQPYKGKIHNATDLYIATFYPAALGKPDSWVMGGQNGTAGAVARANPIFDLNRDGRITAGEFREYYRRRFPGVT